MASVAMPGVVSRRMTVIGGWLEGIRARMSRTLTVRNRCGRRREARSQSENEDRWKTTH